MAKYIDELLMRTLLERMAGQGLDSITVSGLVQTAGINRKTFYSHFSGISELVCRIVLKKYADITRDFSKPENWEFNVHAVMCCLRDNADFVRRVLRSRYAADVQRSLRHELDKAVRIFIRSSQVELEETSGRVYPLSPAQEDFMVKIYAPCIYVLIEEWFLGGMKEPIGEYIPVIGKLTTGGIREGLAYFSEKHTESE
ncbi:MAG: TetR/AcrR family transcriptional regulator [Hominenteromicrobium sp.]